MVGCTQHDMEHHCKTQKQLVTDTALRSASGVQLVHCSPTSCAHVCAD